MNTKKNILITILVTDIKKQYWNITDWLPIPKNFWYFYPGHDIKMLQNCYISGLLPLWEYGIPHDVYNFFIKK